LNNPPSSDIRALSSEPARTQYSQSPLIAKSEPLLSGEPRRQFAELWPELLHDNHARGAFDVGAPDYVMEPALASRLLQAIARIEQALDSRQRDLHVLMREWSLNFPRPPRYLRWINAAVGDSVRLIAVEDVQYFRTVGKYTVLVTADSETLIRKTLRELTEELDPSLFWQIHRSTIVNAHAIQKVHRSCKGRMDLRLKHRMETLTVSAAHAHLFKVM
jgi:DNA-binding LytR/AlgR family response regulator